MTVYRRGGLTWWYVFWYRGKRYRGSTRSTNRETAINVASKLRTRLVEEDAGLKHPSDTTFEDLIKLMEDDLKANKRKSAKDLDSRVKHLRTSFGGKKLARKITPSEIKRHVASRLAARAANATVNRELAALKRAFRLGMEAELVDSMPRITLLREAKPRKGFFDQDRFAAVLAGLPEHLKPVAEFSYYTGWRRSEVTGLRWDHVDLRERGIRLWPGETKNEEGRFLPLDGETWRIVREQRKVVGSPYVFNRRGGKIKTFYKSWRKACNLAGCPGMLFHDFRRTAARNLKRKGLSESDAMAITGHKTASVFKRYAITTENDLRKAVADKGVFQAETGTKTATEKEKFSI